MSRGLINRSPDLRRLRDEGFDIEIKSDHLLVKHIPYVNSKAEVKLGVLVSELTLSGDVTTSPSTHVAHFIGDHPCDKAGVEIGPIKNRSEKTTLGKDLVVDHTFSSKPAAGYKDYHEKMTTYVAIISSPAHSIDATVTARTFPVFEATEEESVFRYVDTASTRAGISAVTSKLELGKIAIVGVGGTGAYVLDLVAKTPVKEIHIYDGDVFSQHNAFRSPGAPSVDDLMKMPRKVHYLRGLYDKMHRGIIPHDCYIQPSNVEQLREIDFVFLSLDKGGDKKMIVERLESWGTPFIDVGMGINLIDGSLQGILRVTTSTRDKRDHVKDRISFSDEGDNDYSGNIQIADLNALNASLAVVKWKKLYGFYLDLEREHHAAYTIDGNHLTNGDQA